MGQVLSSCTSGSAQEYEDLESYQMANEESYQKAVVPDGNDDDNFDIDDGAQGEDEEEKLDEEPGKARKPLFFHFCMKKASEALLRGLRAAKAAEGQRLRRNPAIPVKE